VPKVLGSGLAQCRNCRSITLRRVFLRTACPKRVADLEVHSASGRRSVPRPIAAAPIEPRFRCVDRQTRTPRATVPIGTSCRLVTGMRRKRRTSRNDGPFVQVRVYLLRSTCQPRQACIERPKQPLKLGSREADRRLPRVGSAPPRASRTPCTGSPTRPLRRPAGIGCDQPGPRSNGSISRSMVPPQEVSRTCRPPEFGRQRENEADAPTWLFCSANNCGAPSVRKRSSVKRQPAAPHRAPRRNPRSESRASGRELRPIGPQFGADKSTISTPAGGSNRKAPSDVAGSTTMFRNRMRVRLPNRSTIDVSLTRPDATSAVIVSRS